MGVGLRREDVRTDSLRIKNIPSEAAVASPETRQPLFGDSLGEGAAGHATRWLMVLLHGRLCGCG